MLWQAVLKVLAILVSGGSLGVGGVTRDVSDAEYSQFPRLFHLDDYDTCMLEEHALYCLGTFQITADDHNPTYNLIKTYSEDLHNFNRTRLHRGYCVSSRCPLPPPTTTFECASESSIQPQHLAKSNSSSRSHCISDDHLSLELNCSLRFERCVSKWSRKDQLDVKLISLQYCHTQRDLSEEWKVETPHYVFLGVVGLVLLMNVLGTVYDETRTGEKSKLLTSWSIRGSWRHLRGPFPDGDPRLTALLPVEASRLIVLLLTLFTHSGCIHDMLYVGNPRLVEQMSHHPVMKLLHNGHSVIQMYMILSSFLLAQSILQSSQMPTFWILLKLLLKRIMRIAPVYLLAIGYAATWWPLTRSGPLWAPLVEAESAACRNKFWALAFFMGNFVRDDENCLVQTWYLQVEMQLYIFAIIVTVCLSRVRRWALPILAAMFLASIVGNVLLAYINHWKPFMIVAGPEAVRAVFGNIEEFRGFNTKPWANVGACLVGLFMAHLYHTLQEKQFDPTKRRWLIIGTQLAVPLLPAWTSGSGHLFRDISSRHAYALFMAMERPVMSVLFALVMFGAQNGRGGTKIDKSASSVAVVSDKKKVSATPTKGFMKHIFSWRGLYPLGRMSLAVMTLHWCVNMTFAASRHGLYYTSALDMLVDFLATSCFSYLAAVPVTLLLDIPMQQLSAALLS